ncbi:MAG: helix-hairpin-helix domain-containing protein [Lachnospiraceae bacterium]|nr:helix-hairpin-helix domain-containing protein [Lachnospiraceae bacterium]
MKRNIFMIIWMMAIVLSGCAGSGGTKVYHVAQEENDTGDETDHLQNVNDLPELTDAQDTNDLQNTKDTKELSESVQEEIYIQVCGAVHSPGVYKVSSALRIYEAVEMAGGMTDEAQPDAVNLTKRVYDEMMIYIPTKEEVNSHEYTISFDEKGEQGNAGILQDSGKLVNINTADEQTLMTLPGVGESKALAIISYRQENGEFKTIEEIMNVAGIKKAAFEKIKDKITV